MGNHSSYQSGYRRIRDSDQRSERSASASDSQTKLPPVYSDRYCSLSADGLTIYWLHLWKASSTFAIAEIEKVTPANDIFGSSRGAGLWGKRMLVVKVWGLGGTGILWALAVGRLKPLVLLSEDTLANDFVLTFHHWNTFRAGFTVEDPTKFIEALNQLRETLELTPL